jgi:ribosome-binding factor A
MARGNRRDYARTDRVGELLREILASELAAMDDDRTAVITLTGVEVDNELEKAVVFYDPTDDAEAAAEIEAVLAEVRGRLRAAVSRQARLRKTPNLVFEVDPAITGGRRIDEILSGLDIAPADEGDGAGEAGEDGSPPA